MNNGKVEKENERHAAWQRDVYWDDRIVAIILVAVIEKRCHNNCHQTSRPKMEITVIRDCYL